MDPLELCYLSAGQLSGLIENRELSPVEVIDAHLQRIEATEGVLNSSSPCFRMKPGRRRGGLSLRFRPAITVGRCTGFL